MPAPGHPPPGSQYQDGAGAPGVPTPGSPAPGSAPGFPAQGTQPAEPAAAAGDRPAGARPPNPLPVVSVPKGGGAIRGIGEKFTANPATGTGTIAVPLPMSQARSGFTPSLTLSYDSGGGNGAFGLGWSLDVAAISRKADKGVPAYRDGAGLPQRSPGSAVPPPGAVEDTFTLAGGEDLVPVAQPPQRRTVDGRDYRVRRYRPRVETEFTRVERWHDVATGDAHWRAITRDNVTTVYGRTPASRIADPSDPRRVFSWLACETYDGLGNAAQYEYKAEDGAGVDLAAPHERNRTSADRTANRYLKRVRYGNRAPWRPHEPHKPHEPHEPHGDDAGWLFELVLDYGEHDDGPGEVRPWPGRPDPFSSYRSGFEVRTYRLCRRLLFVHQIPGEPAIGLVRSLEFGHTVQDGLSKLTSVVSRAHSGTASPALPPLEFEYTAAVLDDHVSTVDADTLRNLPVGIPAGPAGRWVDLDGEGLSGVLTEQAGTWFFKANLGGGRLAPLRPVRSHPAAPNLTGGRQELLDLDGDGRLDLVAVGGPAPGFSERTGDGGWTRWQPFRSLPTVDFEDPYLRFVDLNGDGHADAFQPRDDELTWYPSLGAGGFGAGQRVPGRPRVAFNDRSQAVQFADMSGDGLPDLVMVRNAEVCYWPNLGYGRFGQRIVVSDRWLDEPDQFDPRRVRLADVDGSGTTDLIYLHRSGVRLYANRSGNELVPAGELAIPFPRIDSAVQVTVVDLLGSGTACLVWSSPLPGDAQTQLRYVDLMRAGKPHLLREVRNNLGARTTIEYAPSTRFYLADRAAGRPWATRLPFPVHVVQRVQTHDLIGRAVYTTRYAYHHGHFDGAEREFGGFGMVEQWDSEELAALGDDPGNLPPSRTRTWFHTGAYLDERRLAHQYAGEYYGSPLPARLGELPTTLRRPGHRPVPWRLTAEEARQASRALRGRVLREEIYADDGTDAAAVPYGVTSHLHAVELLQPASDAGGPAVFFTYRSHTREEHLERRAGDQRVTDDIVLDVDDYGDVLRSVAVGYGRELADPDPALTAGDRAEQARSRVVVTSRRYTNAVDEPDAYRTPLPCETTVTEAHGLAPSPARFTPQQLRVALDGLTTELPFADWDAPGPGRRTVERTRSLFRSDDLAGVLPLGELQSLALPYETLREALPAGLAETVYGDRVDAAVLAAAGYLEQDGGWWAPSGHVRYGSLAEAQRRFFLPVGFRDPFGAVTSVGYDRHSLLVESSTDAAGNVTTVENDYRALQPRLVRDANGNLTEVAFDAFGRVTATALRGKPGAGDPDAGDPDAGDPDAGGERDPDDLGDHLGGIDPDPDEDVLLAYLADPHRHAHDLLGGATTRVLYDPGAFRRGGVPVVATISRTVHVADVPARQRTPVLQTFAYTDGMGREAQQKVQAEPGGDGRPRWVGTGWTVHNNKGLAVRRYEPFFTASHRFEFARAEGVSPVAFYDPLGRAVATLRPDGSYTKVVVEPWRIATWDGNDTVALHPGDDQDVAGFVAGFLRELDSAGTPWTTWLDASRGGDQRQRAAAEQTLVHAGTPVRAWSDALGRSFVTVLHNRGDGEPDRWYRTRVHHDVQGQPRRIVDPLGRTVSVLDYDAIDNLVRRAGIDTGPGLVLADVLGAPRLTWNARGFRFRTEYDELHRPVAAWASGPGLDGELLHQRTEYGEQQPDAARRNLRQQVYRRYDGAGVLTNERYDPKGNLTVAARELAREYRPALDWSAGVPTDGREYTGRTRFDAQDRPVEVATADGSVVRPGYNAAGMLERLAADLPAPAGQDEPAERAEVVTNIDYNARGQRVAVQRGNGTRTTYEYDPATFRLVRVLTLGGGERLQDLRHWYDPEGNPTAVTDSAQQRLFFRNRVVEPGGSYVYDALYRLVRASGREHIGQTASPPSARGPRPRRLHANDGAAMARYTEHYRYDPVGNLLQVRHAVADPAAPGWTRGYRYDEPSLLEPDRTANRLTAVGAGADDRAAGRFEHDEQGNVTSMPQLADLGWDPEDRLHRTARRAAAPATWMVYDASGQRVRKVADRASGRRRHERIYLGPLELYREYGADGDVTVERTSLHVQDEDERVAIVETRTAGDDRGAARLVRHQLADHLGSAVAELDADGRLIGYEEYHPYGSTAYEAVASKRQVPKRYRYTGRERDAESGLRYHGARYYAPWLARWTSADPAGTKDSLSAYVYVSGNPMRLVDPSGRQGEGRQLNFAELFTQEVMATRTGRGISSTLRRDLRAIWAWWGGHGAIDAGHIGTPQAFLEAGKRGLVAAQPAFENRSLGQLVRLEAAVRRLAGQFVRTPEGVDPTAPAGARYGRVPRAPWRDSPRFRQWLRTWAARAAAAGSAPAAGSAAPVTTALAEVNAITAEASQVARQLDLPFGKAAQAAAKVQQTVASATPAVAEAAAVAKPAAAASQAVSTTSKVVGAVSRAARAAAPVVRVVAKVAGPVAVAASVAEAATAETQSEKAHAAVNLTASVAALSANPVTGIAAGSLAAGGYVGGKVEPVVTEVTGSRAVGVGAGTLAGAATGAAIGAAVGTIVPGVGTAIGAGVGAVAGAIGGFVTSYWN